MRLETLHDTKPDDDTEVTKMTLVESLFVVWVLCVQDWGSNLLVTAENGMVM